MCMILSFFHAGQPTLPATPNLLVRTQSSDSVTVSWETVSTGVNHNVLFYTTDHILLQDVGTSTSAVFDGLEDQTSYLVLLITLSGDSYGVSVTIYDFHFETGTEMYVYMPLYIPYWGQFFRGHMYKLLSNLMYVKQSLIDVSVKCLRLPKKSAQNCVHRTLFFAPYISYTMCTDHKTKLHKDNLYFPFLLDTEQ